MRATRTALALAAATLAGAALAGCNNPQVTEPANQANVRAAAANTGAEASVAGGAGGTRQGTDPGGAGPRELATANTEHAPNKESEAQH